MYQNNAMANTARLTSSPSADLAAPTSATPAEAAPEPTRVHIRRTGTVAVPAPLERSFPLFTPLGERLWAPGWEPRFQFPADGEPCAGATFTTRGEDGRETIWMMADWDPAGHRVRYARVTPGLKTGTVEVVCTPGDRATTVATVTYELTALTPAGDADLATWTEDWYASYLAEWETQIAAALATR
jgi:hypothetical protein